MEDKGKNQDKGKKQTWEPRKARWEEAEMDQMSWDRDYQGSTPGESTKNIGVEGPDSSQDVAKSIVLFSVYRVPRASSTNKL